MRQSIKTWDEESRPREKLMQKGASSLTTAELLAILILAGTKEKSALDLARELLTGADGRLDVIAKMEAHQLKAIDGIGDAKAATLQACFELARRIASELPPDELTIRSADTIFRMMSPLLRDLPNEECWVIYLNRANRYIGREKVSTGGLSATVMDTKIIVKKAVEKLASGIILVHNHPSGNPHPGTQDIVQTEALKRATAVFDIALIDHIVIAGKKYYSFSQENC